MLPQEGVIDLLSEAIACEGRKEGGAKGFIIDGFPANQEQARLFEKLVGAESSSSSSESYALKSSLSSGHHDHIIILYITTSITTISLQVGTPEKIIWFDMVDQLMKMRLQERGNFDDTDSAIQKRIANFKEQTKPILAAYAKTVKKVQKY